MIIVFIIIFIQQIYSFHYEYESDKLIVSNSDNDEPIDRNKLPKQIHLLLKEGIEEFKTSDFNDISLISISIPKSLKELDLGNIDTYELKEINLHQENEYFGYSNGLLYDKTNYTTKLFTNGIKQEEYQFENKISTICKRLLYRNKYIKRIELNKELEKIEENSFDSMENLETIVIGENLKEIEKHVFSKNPKLKEIKVSEKNERYKSDEYGVLINTKEKKIVRYPQGKENKEYTIPADIEIIGELSFENCNGIENIKISKNVKEIEEKAFFGCKKQ